MSRIIWLPWAILLIFAGVVPKYVPSRRMLAPRGDEATVIFPVPGPEVGEPAGTVVATTVEFNEAAAAVGTAVSFTGSIAEVPFSSIVAFDSMTVSAGEGIVVTGVVVAVVTGSVRFRSLTKVEF